MRVLSVRQLRMSVQRDLAWLFNTVSLSAVEDLEEFEEVEASVLNYGIPDLAGHTISSVNSRSLESLIRAVILQFEPRILQRSLRVRLILDEEEMSHNAMVFEITGQLWAQPMPLQLFLKTEVDLEDGSVQVTDQGGGY